MRKIRIGNDIAVQWSLVAKGTGEPFVVEGKDIRLSLKSIFATTEITDYTAQGNKIAWTFKGAEQKQTGIYSLVLSVVDAQGAMVTTDVCQFVELVACSCEANGADEAGVQTESIDLISSIEGASYDDTELREELTRFDGELSELAEALEEKLPRKEFEERIEGYATHDSVQELSENVTELSTEVSGLSEIVENLPSAEDEILKVEYGKTTFQEIKDAYVAGKYIVFEYANNVFHINRVTDTEIYFVSINGTIGYRVGLSNKNEWYQGVYQNEQSTNKVTSLSDKSTDTQYPTAKAVYDAIQQSGTPSGDPMHYMFEAVGATYNATDADIPMVGIFGDSYVHKTHHWHLNELGDITNEEMREIYAERYPTKTMRYMQEWFREASARTTLSSLTQVSSTQGNNIGYKAQCETILFTADINGEIMLANLSDGFYQAKNLRKILGVLNVSSATAIGATSCLCSNLEYVRFKGVKVSANLSLAPKLSNASILYMIENATATGITITLHADAYDRAMADSAITTAMESKQVNLAKA